MFLSSVDEKYLISVVAALKSKNLNLGPFPSKTSIFISNAPAQDLFQTIRF